MNFIKDAKQFAHDAHDSIGQRRKYRGEPYWIHTDAVADTVASVTDDFDMIAAAHLHDVLEDVAPVDKTGRYNADTIKKVFGDTVLKLVVDLTDVYTKAAYPDWNRAKRHEEENKRLAGISPEAMTIKLADLIDNTTSIVADDPNFAKVYLREKLELLPLLASGSPFLLQRAAQQTVGAMLQLGLTIPTIVASV